MSSPIPLYPLEFTPLFRDYVWGGRRLGSLLGKPLPPTGIVAESWEIVDRGPDQSRVSRGPLAGITLGELTRTRTSELLGTTARVGRFPLLFKFLDARETLSVQVHPDDTYAQRLDPPDFGKTEAWVILAADPGAKLYLGLRAGTTREEMERRLAAGTVEACLHQVEPQVGECYFLPPGLVHALGAGLVVAEIQQSSDATFRVFDWNRMGLDGRPRPLHIRQALEVTNFSLDPVQPQQALPGPAPYREVLATCPYFCLERWRLEADTKWGPEGRMYLLAVLAGELEVRVGGFATELAKGSTMLVPACLPPIMFRPQRPTELLTIHIP